MAPISSFILLTLLLPALVRGANDWSQPCFSGVCSWDVDDGTSASGGLTLIGTSNSISDITTAAGWEMLDCQTQGTTTTARIVCSSSDTSAVGCDHVEENGAENKIVRMPSGCGAAPFGRVANMTIAADQSIPSTTAGRLHRRADDPIPQVQQLAIDIDWSAIPVSKNGRVEMRINGANVPGANAPTASSTSSRRRSRPTQTVPSRATPEANRRGLISGFFSKVKSGAGALETAVHSVASEAASAIASTASSISSINDTKTLAVPINVDKSFTLLNKTFGCGTFTANLDVDGDAQATAQLSVSVVAVGTIAPPNLTQFQAVITGNANFAGTLNLDAEVQGQFDSTPITLIGPIGIPGFSIPKIFTIGPQISITGEVTADLGLAAKMGATINYNASNIEIFFPPEAGQTSSATTNVNPSPLQLALSPSVEAFGSVSLHLTPTLDIGVTAFDGDVSAGVFVDLDAALTLNANATASTTVETGGGSVGTQAEDNAAFDGCANLTTTLSFNAGASGDFFGLFNENTQVPIFSRTFDLFAKCFGTTLGAAGALNSTTVSNTTTAEASNTTVVASNSPAVNTSITPTNATSLSNATAAFVSAVSSAAAVEATSNATSASNATTVASAVSSAASVEATSNATSVSNATTVASAVSSAASVEATFNATSPSNATTVASAVSSAASVEATFNATSPSNATTVASAVSSAASVEATFNKARSIRQRAAARRAEAESVAAQYHKRGLFAILAPRANASCPSSQLSTGAPLVNSEVSPESE